MPDEQAIEYMAVIINGQLARRRVQAYSHVAFHGNGSYSCYDDDDLSKRPMPIIERGEFIEWFEGRVPIIRRFPK